MKKIIVLITVVLLSLNSINTQNQTISASYGTFSTNQYFSVLSMRINSIFCGMGDYKFSNFTGPISLSYHRSLECNKRWSFGGVIAYDQARYFNVNSNKAYKFEAFTVATEAKLKYLNPQNKFNMYALWGLGFTVGSDINCNTEEMKYIPRINVHLTTFGIEYGKNVKGFMEFGFGYKGLISGGILVSL